VTYTGGGTERRGAVVVEGRPRGGISVRLPFDPVDAWGDRDAYYVCGTLGAQSYRGRLDGEPGSWRLDLGPSWCRAPGFGPGDEVELVMAPEGPQSFSMGDDIAAAFAAEPAAARSFDSMASFYRNNAARWLGSGKRSETRARRVAEIVDRAKNRQREP
jgi:hypothetical protein